MTKEEVFMKCPWEEKDITYQEWGRMNFDWSNYYKLKYSVPSYFFRLDNYMKGLKNKHIMKSTFGLKSNAEIKKEIDWWFERCIGAYCQIIYKN